MGSLYGQELSAPRQALAVKDGMRGQVERYLVESLLSLQESKKFIRDDSIRIGR
jgi:hypothetical protein